MNVKQDEMNLLSHHLLYLLKDSARKYVGQKNGNNRHKDMEEKLKKIEMRRNE
jgi:hypothetical protein